MVDRSALRTWSLLLALAAIAVVSRLPQLLSKNLLVDGDECVVGLMAKHVVQGKEWPIFFYGQHYGLSSVEAAAGALAFAITGTAPVALKSAMLGLWTLGVLFLFLAQSQIVGRSRAFWITAVFILGPGWAVWSMKARGGYLTSFTAASLLIWMVTRDPRRDSLRRWMIAGALTGLIDVAEPLWLPGVIPGVIIALTLRRRVTWVGAYLVMAAMVVFVVHLAPHPIVEAWPEPPVGNADLLGSLPRIVEQIRVSLTGSYYLGRTIDPPGPVTAGLGLFWFAALPVLAVIQIYRLVTRRYHVWSHVIFASICSTVVTEWALVTLRDARYMLPIGAPLILLAGIEFCDLIDRRLLPTRAAMACATLFLVCGGLSLGEFGRFNYLWDNEPTHLSERQRLQQVLIYLKGRNVSRVFSMNGLLDWQLMFYSNEAVLARATAPVHRYPDYLHEVDRALAAGETVAIVGYTDVSGAPGCWHPPACTGGIAALVPNPQSMFIVDDKYFVYVGADRALLDTLGFTFWE